MRRSDRYQNQNCTIYTETTCRLTLHKLLHFVITLAFSMILFFPSRRYALFLCNSVIANTCNSVLNIDEMISFFFLSVSFKGEKIFIQALFTEIFLESVFFFSLSLFLFKHTDFYLYSNMPIRTSNSNNNKAPNERKIE